MGLLDDIKKAKELKKLIDSGEINEILKKIADNSEIKKEISEINEINKKILEVLIRIEKKLSKDGDKSD